MTDNTNVEWAQINPYDLIKSVHIDIGECSMKNYIEAMTALWQELYDQEMTENKRIIASRLDSNRYDKHTTNNELSIKI